MYRTLVFLLTLVFLFGLAGSTSAELIVHLKLDDGGGTVASDSSGNGFDGELTGDPQWDTGYFGGGLFFNGGDTITLPAEDMELTSEEGSVAFWMNAGPPSGINTMFWAGDNTTGTGFGPENEMHVHLESAVAGIWQGGELSFYVPGAHIHSDPAKGAAGSTPIDPILMGDNEWHHVVATWSSASGNIELYLDGELLSSSGYSTSGFALTNIYMGQMAAANRTYSGLLDDVQIYNEALTAQGVQLSMAGGKEPGPATEPDPENEAQDVRRDVVLGWTPGPYAVTHDVYLGTSFEDVNSADRDDPLGVLVSRDQQATTFDADGLLAFGQTYYWRVDEVNGPPDNFIYKSDVWSFTAEPLTYVVENITVTASTTSNSTSTPAKSIDGSGLNADGGHSITEADMWVGQAAEGEPAWIQFDFDRLYKLQSVHVWNYNHQYESFLGLGVKDITIEYAGDAGQWAAVGDFEVPRGPGLATYAGTTIDLGGIAARSIRINIHNNRSAMQPLNYGLSEVRFNYIPAHAREPEPADGATDVSIDATLAWRPGREAVTHQVNLGTDPNALELVEAVTTDTYDPGMLALATTYYWHIDEVNEAAAPSIWAGDQWSFSTREYLTVDDFESYTDDDGSLVYESWADGFGVASNGSQVGHDNPPYAEQTFVHSGRQAMPFHYGKEGATTSEATLTLAGEDWTRGEAQTLVLYVRGNLENPAGQLYLKVNNTRVDFPGSTASLAGALWQQWNVELASLGNAARNVTSLTLGVSSSGEGLLFIDDIRLYRSAEPMPGPAADPGSASLAAHYTMTDNVADSSGNGYGGTAEVGSSFGQGPAGYGRALVLDGVSGYATLPIGSLIQSLDSITVASWVNYAGVGSWQRLFDFGTGTDVYMFLTPDSGADTLRFAITTGGTDGEAIVEGASSLPDGWRHVAVTVDGATGQMVLYLDGLALGSATTTTLPSDLGETTQNWIGRSQYTADAYFNGSVDDFRIYNRALSDAEIRYLVGAR